MCIDAKGRSPFGQWFDALNGHCSYQELALTSPALEAGDLSNVKGVGGGVLEFRLHFGPGYRVYLGRDGDALIVLLIGGTKVRRRGTFRQMPVSFGKIAGVANSWRY